MPGCDWLLQRRRVSGCLPAIGSVPGDGHGGVGAIPVPATAGIGVRPQLPDHRDRSWRRVAISCHGSWRSCRSRAGNERQS